jgi:Response regulator containing CheY-like receiver, AAA-type ATPase, and DNA-binding domains
MINTQKLLEISELKLSGKIEQMDEGKLNNFVQLLNSFSDNLPALEKKINDALVAKNNDALKKFLTAVRDILVKIYAEEMAQDCTKQIGRIGAEKHEKIEAYMRYFLSTLSMLSADIQKAQQQTGKSAGAPKKDTAAAENESINKKNDSIILEKLLEISELNTEKIEQMEEDEFINYLQFLNAFTERYPEQEEKINEALKTKDNDALKKNLTDIKEILEKILADEMAQDCAKQINAIGSTSPEKIEAYMRYFLSSLSMLSIDIQMAGQKIETTIALPQNAQDDKVKSGIKILAVDDTAFFLTILKKILQDTRFKLACVSSGRDALKYLEKHQPDIFLLDIEMPGMDGYELAARIKERGYKAPIIFLTGNAKKEYLAKAVKAGAVDFIIKPINKDVLLSKIYKYIRQ